MSTKGSRGGGRAREEARELASAAQFMAQEGVGASVLVACSRAARAGKQPPLPPTSSRVKFRGALT